MLPAVTLRHRPPRAPTSSLHEIPVERVAPIQILIIVPLIIFAPLPCFGVHAMATVSCIPRRLAKKKPLRERARERASERELEE